jgi:hypothetical protein
VGIEMKSKKVRMALLAVNKILAQFSAPEGKSSKKRE